MPDDVRPSIEELISTISDMNRRILELESNAGEEKWLEGSLRQRTRDLSERVKELECLYALLESDKNPATMAGIIRNGWQFPGETCVRLRWDGRETATPGFRSCVYRTVEPLIKGSINRGDIEVGTGVPFLKEETVLLKAIARLLPLLFH